MLKGQDTNSYKEWLKDLRYVYLREKIAERRYDNSHMWRAVSQNKDYLVSYPRGKGRPLNLLQFVTVIYEVKITKEKVQVKYQVEQATIWNGKLFLDESLQTEAEWTSVGAV